MNGTMNETARNRRPAAPGVCGMVKGTRTFAIAAVAVLALALAVSSVSVVQAQDAEQTATAEPTAAAGPPLGDCWSGVLSQDPLHCYALEQAEREKLIDVTALYAAPGGPLYVWLRQTGPVSGAVYAFLRAKSYEFYDRWPEQVVDDLSYAGFCSGGYRECILDRISWNEEFMLPWLSVHGYAVFHVGGEEAQRGQVAWASWRRLWPNPDGARDFHSAGVFDISDVDTTNFPACTEDSGCWFSGKLAGLGLAGIRGVSSLTENASTTYVQVKDPPEDPAELEALRHALRDRLWPCQGRIGPCTYVEDGETVYTEIYNRLELEIVPVKYSYEELRRWAIVLDRFANSEGNTVGILGSWVDTNNSPWVVYPFTDLQFAEHEANYRTTVLVLALDENLLIAALPTLLPQLGIPVDAVGMVSRDSRGPGISYLADDPPSGGEKGYAPPLGQGGSGDGLPLGAIAGAASLVAVTALGAIIGWRRRS